MYKNKDYFLIDRPLFEKFNKDQFDIPIPKLENFAIDEIANCNLVSYSNLISTRGKSEKILNGFTSDKILTTMWNNPFRLSKIGKEYFAIMTPDMSVNFAMNSPQIIYATYQNRWMGCFLQQYGIHILITVSWAFSNTYDICFNSIPKGSPIAISTLGCQNEKARKIFLDGLTELKKRIDPKFILVFGNTVKGMIGEYIVFSYEDLVSTNSKFKQMQLFPTSKIITMKGES